MSLVQLGRPPSGRALGLAAAPGDRAAFARRTVAFTSGKGGVGKSTVAVNVACALAQRGLRVGLLDADVHGPSVPRMLGLDGERVRWEDGPGGRMIPAENFGLRVMSVGLTTAEADTPLVWRSSVATAAVVQLVEDVAWGPLDVLAVDLPPGTGDVQITLAEELRLAAAVVVTTPQPVATDDVARAIRMLRESGVPVAGVVENMSALVLPDGTVLRPFGQGGGRRLAGTYGVPFLGEIPLDPVLREAADEGRPIAATGTDAQRVIFANLAAALADALHLGPARATDHPRP